MSMSWTLKVVQDLKRHKHISVRQNEHTELTPSYMYMFGRGAVWASQLEELFALPVIRMDYASYTGSIPVH
jgi:hypothetical protein